MPLGPSLRLSKCPHSTIISINHLFKLKLARLLGLSKILQAIHYKDLNLSPKVPRERRQELDMVVYRLIGIDTMSCD